MIEHEDDGVDHLEFYEYDDARDPMHVLAELVAECEYNTKSRRIVAQTIHDARWRIDPTDLRIVRVHHHHKKVVKPRVDLQQQQPQNSVLERLCKIQ